MFTVYILSCADSTYHFGVTKNLESRLAYHSKGQNPFTADKLPVKIVFQEDFHAIKTANTFRQELDDFSEDQIKKIISGKMSVGMNPNSTPEKEDLISLDRSIVMPSAYLGNLFYFLELKEQQQLRIDLDEHFQKQTYRSRCTILTANGIQNLVVPVIRPNGKETRMSEVKISYAENWQKDHIKAIESAYRRAPYYEFYADDLFVILQKKHERLVDLNTALTQFVINAFSWNCEISEAINETSELAIKKNMTPKNRKDFTHETYRQVFSDGDFEPNLSIIDWLFNQGKL